MSTLPSPTNAIVYAQFNAQGRWLRLLSVAIGYGVVLGSIIWVTDVAASANLKGWVAGLCVLQALNLFVFGAFRVESGVRGDVSSRMLESHRLMPTLPLGSILGYMFGASLQALLLAAVNFILGAICCICSGIALEMWALSNGVLLLFAMLVYSFLVQLAFVTRGGFLLVLIAGFFLGAAANDDSLIGLPAVTVLINPLVSRSSVFLNLLGGFRAQHSLGGYLISFIMQAALMMIFIRAGVRRYTSPTLAGISERLGLLLLAIWVGLIALYNAWPEYFEFRYRYYSYHTDHVTAVVANFATSMLLALIPIGSAAWAAREAQQSGQLSNRRPRVVASEIATVLAASALVLGLLVNLPVRVVHLRYQSLLTGIIIVNFLAAAACLFSWGYLIRKRAWIFVVIWMLMTWLVPVAADGIYRSVNDLNSDFTVLTAFNPPGALAQIWSDSAISAIPGVVAQVALTGLPVAILLFTQRLKSRKLGKS